MWSLILWSQSLDAVLDRALRCETNKVPCAVKARERSEFLRILKVSNSGESVSVWQYFPLSRAQIIL